MGHYFICHLPGPLSYFFHQHSTRSELMGRGQHWTLSHIPRQCESAQEITFSQIRLHQMRKIVFSHQMLTCLFGHVSHNVNPIEKQNIINQNILFTMLPIMDIILWIKPSIFNSIKYQEGINRQTGSNTIFRDKIIIEEKVNDLKSICETIQRALKIKQGYKNVKQWPQKLYYLERCLVPTQKRSK